MTNTADVISSGFDRPPSRLRRLAQPALLAAGATAVLLAAPIIDGQEPAAPPTAPPTPVPAAAALSPLVAPDDVAPGEQIVVLAQRNPRLCGPAELRFDGAPLRHRLAWNTAPPHADRGEVFLRLQVPSSAAPGDHRLDLFGPVPGGSGTPTCTDVRERQARLATVTITVTRLR
jgi:hypothetical protein